MADRKRSEEVRERRARRALGENKSRKKPTTSRRNTQARSGRVSSASREMPPMVSRRGVMGAAARPATRTRKEARRRYDVALPITGAEMRLPAVPQVRFGWRLLSFIIVLALLWSLYTVWTAPQFQVATVEVEGLARIPQYEIESIIGVTGMSIFAVDADQALARLVKEFPDLSAVTIQIGFPAVVRVVVTERQPVISWHIEGIDHWVDEGGYSFVARGEQNLIIVIASAPPPAPAIPLNVLENALNGRELADLDNAEFAQLTEDIGPRPYMTPEIVRSVQKLAPHVPETAALVFHPERGLGWFDEDHGWTVYFGSKLDRLDERLNVYAAIVARFEKDKIPAKLISIEYLNAPYYRFVADK